MDIQDISGFYPALILPILVKITHMKLDGKHLLTRVMRRYEETELAIGRWIDMVEGRSGVIHTMFVVRVRALID